MNAFHFVFTQSGRNFRFGKTDGFENTFISKTAANPEFSFSMNLKIIFSFSSIKLHICKKRKINFPQPTVLLVFYFFYKASETKGKCSVHSRSKVKL